MNSITSKSWLYVFIFGFLFLLVTGCGSSSSGGGGTPASPITTLYTGDTGNDRIAVWESANTVNGDVAPDRIISGATSGIGAPYDLSYDSRTDSLFVGNLGTTSIKIYDGISAINGDVAPSRTLGGGLTLIGGYITAIDRTRDKLYVVHANGVLVFNGAGTVDGNIAPDANITGANTLLDNSEIDKRIFIDESNDRLYVSLTDGVVVFNNVSTKDGNIAPDRTIIGGATGFSFLWGIQVDVARDILYVADESNNEVYIFDNASTITGNISPDRILSGVVTSLDNPADIFLDTAANTLYVTNEGLSSGILIWNNASTVNGNIAPNRAITGASTGVSNVDSIVGAR